MGRFLCRAPLPRSRRGSPSPPRHAAGQNPRPLTGETYATQKKGGKKSILMHRPGLRMSPCSAPREGCGPTEPVAAGTGFGQRRGPACDGARVRLVLVVAPQICPPWGRPRAPSPTGHPGGASSPRGTLRSGQRNTMVLVFGELSDSPARV